jgi:hypothetical protein
MAVRKQRRKLTKAEEATRIEKMLATKRRNKRNNKQDDVPDFVRAAASAPARRARKQARAAVNGNDRMVALLLELVALLVKDK